MDKQEIKNLIANLDEDSAIHEYAEVIEQINIHLGWYDKEKTLTEDCMLLVSEAAEAFEEVRDGHGENEIYFTHDKNCPRSPGQVYLLPPYRNCCTPKPEGFPTELADLVIRAIDTANRRGIDLAFEIRRKSAYNLTRKYRHGNKVL